VESVVTGSPTGRTGRGVQSRGLQLGERQTPMHREAGHAPRRGV